MCQALRFQWYSRLFIPTTRCLQLYHINKLSTAYPKRTQAERRSSRGRMEWKLLTSVTQCRIFAASFDFLIEFVDPLIIFGLRTSIFRRITKNSWSTPESTASLPEVICKVETTVINSVPKVQSKTVTSSMIHRWTPLRKCCQRILKHGKMNRKSLRRQDTPENLFRPLNTFKWAN